MPLTGNKKTYMNRILITGAGGYIGTTLVEQCLAKGWDVIALDLFFFGQERLGESLNHPNLTLVHKDIREVRPMDFKNIDVVLDLAAISNDPAGDLVPELTESINHLGRAHVASCAKEAGVERYILASSCSIYGQGGDQKLDETAPPNPLTVYARANLAAEKSTLALADSKFSVSVVRQSTVFGLSGRMRFDLVINIMTLNAHEKGKLFVNGGQQWRPLVHVADTARAISVIAEAPVGKVNGEIFNVGHSNLQVLDIAHIIRDAMPTDIDLQIVPNELDKRDYQVSFDKIKNVLGFKANYDIEDGVKEICKTLQAGDLKAEPWTYTVSWYKSLIEEQKYKAICA